MIDTVIHALFDPTTSRIRLARAGHAPRSSPRPQPALSCNRTVRRSGVTAGCFSEQTMDPDDDAALIT